MYRLLFVDDDVKLLEVLRQYFIEKGFDVLCAGNAGDAEKLIRSATLDCIVLDVGIPGNNGFRLCSMVREFTSVPIIFLSCYTEEDCRVKGFLSGADDYICKPFSIRELELRIMARIHSHHDMPEPELLQFGDLSLDMRRMAVEHGGEEYYFPKLEFDILVFFAKHPNQLFTYEQLYDGIWKQPLNESRHNLHARVAKVRQKLCEICPDKEYIKTVRKMGYIFIP